MNEIMFADGLVNEEELAHYGIKRRSGRYPWGSGENPYHHGMSSPFGRKKSDGEGFHLTAEQKKRAIQITIAAAATVGAIYLAKSGKLDGLVDVGKLAAKKALERSNEYTLKDAQKDAAKRMKEAGRLGEIEARKEAIKIRKDRKAALGDRRMLSDEELISRINRLKREKELRDLSRDDLYPGKKDVDEATAAAIKKIVGAAAGGAGVVGAEYLIRRYLNDEMSKEELAKAVKEQMRPKKK